MSPRATLGPLFIIMSSSPLLAATSVLSGSGWRFLYFDAPTRGEQVRLLFKVARQPFQDVRLAFPKGLAKFKQCVLGDDSPLLFDQCPTVISPQGQALSQTAAIMAFVGRELGHAPTDPYLHAKATAITIGCEEARNKLFYGSLISRLIAGVLDAKLGLIATPLVSLIAWKNRRSHRRYMRHFCAPLKDKL